MKGICITTLPSGRAVYHWDRSRRSKACGQPGSYCRQSRVTLEQRGEEEEVEQKLKSLKAGHWQLEDGEKLKMGLETE
jgi:hypothetical protein